MNTSARRDGPTRTLPKNYHLVLDVIAESGVGCHLTMNDVYAEASRRRPGIGHSTVYRALVRLRDAGLISEIVVPGRDAATYEPTGPKHAHVHCSACGRIDDVPFTLPGDVLASVASSTGFAIDDGTVTFAGRCADCRTAQAFAGDRIERAVAVQAHERAKRCGP